MTSPDTGAGTPLTAEEERRHAEAPWPPYRGRNRSGSQCAYCNRTWPCDARRAIVARSRPATDPAGLDVERLAEAQAAVDLNLPPDDPTRIAWRQTEAQLADARAVAAEYARLSVADGPGPEDEWCDLRSRWPNNNGEMWCHTHGLPASHAVADGPGPEERPDWRGYLNAIRRLLVASPPNADSIDAAIGYALNACEAAIDAAIDAALPAAHREDPTDD